MKVTDKSFRSNLKVNDVLVTKEDSHYIVTENQSESFPYQIVNMLTYQVKEKLQTLEGHISPTGFMLNIGHLKKIIDADNYESELVITFKKASL